MALRVFHRACQRYRITNCNGWEDRAATMAGVVPPEFCTCVEQQKLDAIEGHASSELVEKYRNYIAAKGNMKPPWFEDQDGD